MSTGEPDKPDKPDKPSADQAGGRLDHPNSIRQGRTPEIAALLCVLVLSTGGARPPAAPPGGQTTPRAVLLPAPPRYEQIDSASCEAASVHIALHMLGMDVPEQRLIAALPVDHRPPQLGPNGAVVAWGDPYRAFVGDITRGDRWPLVGYGVYAPPILALVRREGMRGSFGGSAFTLTRLRRALDAGQPVIVWVPKLSLYPAALRRRTWRAWDGRMVPWNEDEHAQVLVGYDATGFWLDNPDYTYRSHGQWLWHYTTAQFTTGWGVLGNQAVVVARRPARHVARRR